MRHFGYSQKTFHFSSIASRSDPGQPQTNIENGDEPRGQRISVLQVIEHASRRGHHSYFDFLWPSSTSPSASLTDEMETTSPLSPDTEMVVSSCLIHSSPHFVMFLFFQCQFAVDGGRAMTKKGGWRKRKDLMWLIAFHTLFILF